MGGPMVERLLAADAEVHLYARRAEVADRFASLGAIPEPSVGALAESAGVLILCPFSEDQLFEITDGADGILAHARPDSVIVQHATVSPSAVERLAERALANRITVLDAPISGRAEAIRSGTLTVLVGGDDSAVRRVEPALCAYSDAVVRTGAVGSATRIKLINNLAFAAHVQIAGAVVELGDALGVPRSELLAALKVCSARSFALDTLRSIGDPQVFGRAAAPYLRKDVAVVDKAISDLGLDTNLLGEVVRSGPFPLTEA
jgi:3-hydroxyisobutyrate dehydrogenase-like beta-hydroxyacid dehydrogenase